MATITYITPVDDISSGIKVAFDIYSGSGMTPKIISDGKLTVKFDSIDAAALVYDRITTEKYAEKHKID